MVIEGTFSRDTALDAGRACGVLAGAGLEDLAHDHVVDLLAADPGLLQGAFDGDAAQVGPGEGPETPEQATIGGASSRDDYTSGHDAS